MKDLLDKVIAHPVATSIVVGAMASGIVAIIKAFNKTK